MPLPRRRVLREWRTGIRPAAARLVSLRVASCTKGGSGSSAALSDAARHAHWLQRVEREENIVMFDWLKTIGHWFDARLGFRDTLLPMLRHPVPRAIAGPMGWWYVFGSASMTLFMIQILTGIGLALVYVPAADKAYESLLYLNYQQPLGWFLRALHYYAGSGMVVMVLVHMTQVFLHGAYKYPRELTWVMGVFLLLHAGHVLYGPGPPLGSGRLLGPGRRRVDGRPGAGAGP